MRQSTAIVVVILLAVASAETVRADEAVGVKEFRNPIEWLLDDIGKLLQTATSKLTHKPTPSGSSTVQKESGNVHTVAAPDDAAHEVVAGPKSEPAVESQVETDPDSVTQAGAKAFRNPLAWLLSDLARIFQPDLKIEQKTALADAPSPAQPETPVALTTAADTVTPQNGTTDAETDLHVATETVQSGTQNRNPIVWLFRDLANLFAPKTIDKNPSTTAIADVSDTVDVTPVETPAPDAPLAKNADDMARPLSDSVEVEIKTEAEAASQPDETTAPVASPPARDPISWLFRDLAKLLSPADTNDETAATEIPEAPTPFEPLVAETPDAAVNEEKAPQISDMISAPEPVEIAPWVPRPQNGLFNPDGSLFTTNGTPLLTMEPTPPAPEPEPVVSAAVENAPTTPEIRQRAPYRPGARNHAALGRQHKAVTPDPVDDSLIDRVLENLFGIDGAAEAEAEETLANKVSDRIVPEENLDLGYTSPDAAVPDQELTRIGDGPLNNIDLYMGNDSVIGTPYVASAYKADTCVERALHGSVFCLKNLNWPPAIAASFATDTAFVLPGEGVVRYENGTVSRVYAVFNAGEFANVVKYMQHRFGPPQEREIGWMHMLEAPKLPNTTFRWQAFNADRTDAIVLEVRNYDDLRRSFADMDHGMVRLYRNGSRPIFKHISTMDLMLMQRRRLARAPVEINQPPKQQ